MRQDEYASHKRALVQMDKSIRRFELQPGHVLYYSFSVREKRNVIVPCSFTAPLKTPRVENVCDSVNILSLSPQNTLNLRLCLYFLLDAISLPLFLTRLNTHSFVFRRATVQLHYFCHFMFSDNLPRMKTPAIDASTDTF